MARQKKEDSSSEDEKLPDIKSSVRSLRNSLNKGDDIMAWDLTKDDSPTVVKDFISTGSTLLDYVASNRENGGVPCGKLTEIQGEESSGKSLICAHIAANTQKKGGIVVYLDTENAANPDFMKRIGVDLSSMIYVQPGTIENAFESIESVIKTLRAKSSTTPVTIIWDSVGNTPPQAEIEGDYDPNSRMGLGAKAMAKGLRKITDLIGKEQITLVFTNPLKYAMGGSPYADPFITPYGKAVPYHSSLRIRLTSSTKLKSPSGEIYGIITNGRIIKTRLGPGHRSTKFEIHFDYGIDDERSWFDLLHDAGMISKSDGWCYIEEIPSGKLAVKGVHEGKDRGLQFREKEWASMARTQDNVRKWALSTIKKLLVKVYDETRPSDREGIEIPNEDSEIVESE